MELKTRALRVEWRQEVAIIVIDDPDKPVNTFSVPVLEDLEALLTSLESHASIKGIVMSSGKIGNFLAGVDIGIFDTLNSAESGENASKQLHRLFKKLADSKVPTVAAIDGTCLGGGFEMSLACQYRICTDDKSTELALPEVQLGILPGGGGTQRLPRLIGIASSLEFILTGKKLDAKKAFKLGVVDAVVPRNQLIERAVNLCLQKKKTGKNKIDGLILSGKAVLAAPHLWSRFKPLQWLLELNPFGRSIIQKKSSETIFKTTKGRYPAPTLALKAVMEGTHLPIDQGLELEAKLFGELVSGEVSRSLVHIFRLITGAKKIPVEGQALEQGKKLIEKLRSGAHSIGILGAGLMGSGVATVLANKNYRTVLLDRDAQGMARGLKAVKTYFDDLLRKRRIKKFDRDHFCYHVQPTLNAANLKDCPFVVEAVFEDLKIKHDILKACENQHGNKPFIFASNTSSIPIEQVAAVAKHPDHVIGMHFFSPVPKMPLVEIIKHPTTAPHVIAATYELALKMGKNVVLVNDGPGFYTTRILAFLIAEALALLSEGAKIEDIDSTMEKFGMPVGPITLLDEVGIDVGWHIIQVLKPAFTQRLVVPTEVEAIYKDDRKGRKNGRGLYLYKDGKKLGPDESVYKFFANPRKEFNKEEILDRCVHVFLNEAAWCLEDGIIATHADGDMGAIFGLGFPPFLGGPFFYARKQSHQNISAKLNQLAGQFGERFKPAPYWRV